MTSSRFSIAVPLAAFFAIWVPFGSASAKDFTFSEKANPRLAKKFSMPVYFALPSSTRAKLKGDFPTTDILVDFKHPDAMTSGSDAGLRVIEARRAGLSQRLAKSGIIQTGDLLLTFRPEWGGAGAYPNVQMGISHTGVAYVKDGKVHNIDNPLNEEYHGRGMRSDLTSSHYKDAKFLHVVRPRGLTEKERSNIVAWAKRLNSNARKIYPAELKFNDDYNAPKYKRRRALGFVKHLAEIALGQKPSGTLDLYCSEFAWSLLALRGCDPETTAGDFKGSRVPSCVKIVMDPMDPTGNNISRPSRRSYMGLVDGPLTVIDQLKISRDEKSKLLQSVFVENPAQIRKMSEGHRKVATSMQPKFERLQNYYLGVKGGTVARLKARLTRATFNASVPENYSPTSFLLNTLLPVDNSNRTMDYVATIAID
ncbi:MAG: hypothetical protein KDJ37_05745 [Hyphomicrobiaceae bacterium]|nr:hypothetical protein [Hyphomicrobiaceae bacterium]